MKKNKTVDELIRLLEETVRGMQEGGTSIFIDVQINPCQNMFPVSQEVSVHKKNNTSVDILETEKNIYALVGLPGVKTEDIVLSCNGWALEIRSGNAENIDIIELPARVIKTGMKVTFKNDVLEVVLNKSKKGVSKKKN